MPAVQDRKARLLEIGPYCVQKTRHQASHRGALDESAVNWDSGLAWREVRLTGLPV